MREWEELEVSGWKPSLFETRGLRAKCWVVAPDGTYWLRKEPRESRPYEPAIEAMMLRLADEAGIVAADGSACRWTQDGETKSGLVVRLFVDRKRETLASGAELLMRHDVEYDPEAKWEHTLDHVRALLLAHHQLGGLDLAQDFARILAFDAWTGNGDRHQENWGLIIPEGGGPRRLAPLYDPAACLGAELLDDAMPLDPARCTADALLRYVERCPSGFGDGRKPLTLREVVDRLADWPEWTDNVRRWVADFHLAMDTFRTFLARVPPSWLPQPRKDFALRVLQRRLEWLDERTRGAK